MGKNHTNEKIAIITDTGSYMSKEDAKKSGIWVLPLQIIEKNNQQIFCYNDLEEIDTNEVYEKIYNEVSLSTSLPVLAYIYDAFTEIKEMGYDSAIVIPLTPAISSTASNMMMIANELSLPVSLIDTFSTCQIQQYIVKKVKKLIDLSFSRDEIVRIINKQISHSHTFLLAKDINHLKRGGRLTPLAASMANMLKIVPILQIGPVTEGKIDVFDKVRTEKKARKVIVSETVSNMKHDCCSVFILHSDDEQTAQEVKKQLIEAGVKQDRISIHDLNSVIAVHVGMKAIVIQYIENLDI